MLLVERHRRFKLLAKADTLISVRFIFDENLVYLSHFDSAFDLIDFNVAFLHLTALLANGALVTVDELLGLSMLLGSRRGCRIGRRGHDVTRSLVRIEATMHRCARVLARRMEDASRSGGQVLWLARMTAEG